MNPEISKLFEEIEFCAMVLKKARQGEIKAPVRSKLKLFLWILECKEKIKEISATLNPQIPEPYASMSRDEILERIGWYDKNKSTTHA